MAITRLSDAIIPEIFNPYFQTVTSEKTAVIQSGAAVMNERLNAQLRGGGLTFNAPSFSDLEKVKANIMTDDPFANGGGTDAVPQRIRTKNEIVSRMLRHQSWGQSDLVEQLSGAKPMRAIGNRIGYYWARERQENFISIWNGVFANNALPTDAFHVQNDMLHDAGVGGTEPFDFNITAFSALNFNAALLTMGDSMADLSLVMVHPTVYTTMKNKNLIAFLPESTNEAASVVPTYLGARVIMDNAMPNSGGFFDSWIFGAGSTLMGAAPFAGEPSEVERQPRAGGGAGEEVIHTRVNWATHPVGYAYVGGVDNPEDLATAGNYGAAASWERRYVERNQIKAARLVTREF